MRPRVMMLDPNSHTLPYDLALARALEVAGCSVDLVASRFLYDELPLQEVVVRERFFKVAASRLARWAKIAERHRLRRLIKTVEYPIDWLALICQLAEWRPDIVHVQWSLQPKLEVGLWHVLKRCGIPIVYTAHDVRPHDAHEQASDRYARLYRAADAVMAHTSRSAQQLVNEFQVPAERVHVAPHGPLLEGEPELSRGDARQQLGLSRDATLILFTGLIEPYKGLTDLVAAFLLVADGFPDAHLVIAGRQNVPIQVELEAVKNAGLSGRVHFDLRYLPNATLAAYLCAADIVVLPYRATTSSGMLLAAMRFGRAVIASRVGDLSVVIEDGQTGLLAPPADPVALAAALSRLLADPRLRERLGAAGKRVAMERDTWTVAADRTLAVYRSLLAG